ncbi:hypothetical protein VB713_21155 [Anabaena cylindrica UHCC 0172]|uniref:hypothetical protein n=1 Tax=Anabaena cylindrica TaxID=1165 RepID=UPI002B2218A5|nr:hypothetical protein [Anabaena cylindrica]MEA5553450.1 hypothetical protein [Anabaena cylindrica UHCC 0172]
MNTKKITQEEFEKILDTMETYAISCAQTWGHRNLKNRNRYQYILPSDIKENAKNEEVPQMVKDIFDVEESQMNADDSEEEAMLTKVSYDFIESPAPDIAKFNCELDAADEKAIANYSQRRKQRTERLKEAGREHPHARHAIVEANRKVDSFVDKISHYLDNFVNTLANSITTWVSSAFLKIANTFKDAANQVVNFFGGLFSTTSLVLKNEKKILFENPNENCWVSLLGMSFNNFTLQPESATSRKVSYVANTATCLQATFDYQEQCYLAINSISDLSNITKITLTDVKIVYS